MWHADVFSLASLSARPLAGPLPSGLALCASRAHPSPSTPHHCQHLLRPLRTSTPAVSSITRFPSNVRMALDIMPFLQRQCKRIWQVPPDLLHFCLFHVMKYAVGDSLPPWGTFLLFPKPFFLYFFANKHPSHHILCWESASFLTLSGSSGVKFILGKMANYWMLQTLEGSL